MSASLVPEGFYDGTVVEARLQTAYKSDEDELEAVFEVVITSEGPGFGQRVKCKHRLYGEKMDKAKAVVESLGIAFPDGLEDLSPAIDKHVRIRAGEFNGHGFARIVLGGSGSGDDPERIKAGLAKLRGEDNLPF